MNSALDPDTEQMYDDPPAHGPARWTGHGARAHGLCHAWHGRGLCLSQLLRPTDIDTTATDNHGG